jgi:hypothetical protein
MPLNKKLVLRMLIAQSLGKCSNLEILAKVEIKESNFFKILAKVLI